MPVRTLFLHSFTRSCVMINLRFTWSCAAFHIVRAPDVLHFPFRVRFCYSFPTVCM